MTKGTVTTDIVYLPINEVSWLVSHNNNNNNLNRGIPRVPLLVDYKIKKSVNLMAVILTSKRPRKTWKFISRHGNKDFMLFSVFFFL